MKLEGIVDVIYVNVIFKFGYDQINISYRNVLLKIMSNLHKFGCHKKKIANLIDLIFILNGAISL